MNKANEHIENSINIVLQKISLDINHPELQIEKHIQNIEWLSIYSDLIINRNIIAPIKYTPVAEIDTITQTLKNILIRKIQYGLCKDIFDNPAWGRLSFPLNDMSEWMTSICENKLLGLYEYSIDKTICYYKNITLLANGFNQNTGALDGIIEQLSYWLWEIKERK